MPLTPLYVAHCIADSALKDPNAVTAFFGPPVYAHSAPATNMFGTGLRTAMVTEDWEEAAEIVSNMYRYYRSKSFGEVQYLGRQLESNPATQFNLSDNLVNPAKLWDCIRTNLTLLVIRDVLVEKSHAPHSPLNNNEKQEILYAQHEKAWTLCTYILLTCAPFDMDATSREQEIARFHQSRSFQPVFIDLLKAWAGWRYMWQDNPNRIQNFTTSTNEDDDKKTRKGGITLIPPRFRGSNLHVDFCILHPDQFKDGGIAAQRLFGHGAGTSGYDALYFDPFYLSEEGPAHWLDSKSKYDSIVTLFSESGLNTLNQIYRATENKRKKTPVTGDMASKARCSLELALGQLLLAEEIEKRIAGSSDVIDIQKAKFYFAAIYDYKEGVLQSGILDRLCIKPFLPEFETVGFLGAFKNNLAIRGLANQSALERGER